MIGSLLTEFEHETRTTRKHLERLPDDKLDWRPHEKSFTAGGLASHIDPATYQSFQAKSVADLLQAFDEKVATGKQALANATDATAMQLWRLKVKGRVRIERLRAAVFRDFTLSHVIHHRGQLSVYLRLLNVAVPGSYGPSADEQ